MADIICPHCGKVLRGAGGSVGGGEFFHVKQCPGSGTPDGNPNAVAKARTLGGSGTPTTKGT